MHEQMLDPLGALVGVCIGEKARASSGAGNSPIPSREERRRLGIGSEVGRKQAEFPELRIGEWVDEIG